MSDDEEGSGVSRPRRPSVVVSLGMAGGDSDDTLEVLKLFMSEGRHKSARLRDLNSLQLGDEILWQEGTDWQFGLVIKINHSTKTITCLEYVPAETVSSDTFGNVHAFRFEEVTAMIRTLESTFSSCSRPLDIARTTRHCGVLRLPSCETSKSGTFVRRKRRLSETLYKISYDKDVAFSTRIVLERAYAVLYVHTIPGAEAQLFFDLLTNNSEHFTTWCKTGQAFSDKSGYQHVWLDRRRSSTFDVAPPPSSPPIITEETSFVIDGFKGYFQGMEKSARNSFRHMARKFHILREWKDEVLEHISNLDVALKQAQEVKSDDEATTDEES